MLSENTIITEFCMKVYKYLEQNLMKFPGLYLELLRTNAVVFCLLLILKSFCNNIWHNASGTYTVNKLKDVAVHNYITDFT